MNFKQLTQTAIDLYALNVDGHTMTMEVLGPPGCGKTAWAKSLASELEAETNKKVACCIRHLTVVDPLDAHGVLHIKAGRGDKPAQALRTYPALFPQPWEFPGLVKTGQEVFEVPGGVIPARGVLVLDEYGQADQDQHKSTATLIDERRLGEYRLPPGWMVVCTSNRMEDRSAVQRQLAFITTRLIKINMAYDPEQHAAWLQTHGISPALAGFVMSHPGVVQVDQVPKEDGPYGTARGFERVCRILDRRGGIEHLSYNDKLPPDLPEIISGTVGPACATRLTAHIKYCKNMPSMEAIIDNPDTTPIPERADVIWATVQMMIHGAEECGNDLHAVDSIMRYVLRLPINFQIGTVRQLGQASAEFINTTHYQNWARENHDVLMTAVGETQRRNR